MPFCPFANGFVPSLPVPIRLRWITILGAFFAALMPLPRFPEIRLRAAGIGPPIRLSDAPNAPPSTEIPSPLFGNAAIPVTSTPMKFP